MRHNSGFPIRQAQSKMQVLCPETYPDLRTGKTVLIKQFTEHTQKPAQEM